MDRIGELAESMIPAHAGYSEELTAEMAAMADAAGLSLGEAIVVGGFTDFVDTVRGQLGAPPEEDDCTAVIAPGPATADGRAILGQTWDMHDSATRHVLMLDLRPDSGPAALVFTTEGCLGQMGMNEAGLAIGINNLAAQIGTLGVTWPFVVRRALQQASLDDAIDCVLEAELAGAHNYMLVDGEGRGVNIEAMPQATQVTPVETGPFLHTNHTLAAATTAFQAVRPTGLMESSQRRLERGQELIGSGPVTPERVMEMTRDAEAVCQTSQAPYHIESCGGIVMRPATGELWAVWGRPDMNEYQHFALSAV